MNRRALLAGLGASMVGACAPAPVLAGPTLPVWHAPLGTTGWREAGNSIRFLASHFTSRTMAKRDASARMIERVMEVLHADARQALPKGMRYEIREAVFDLGRQRGFAWYAHSGFVDRPTWGQRPERAEYREQDGCWFRGEFTA